MEVDVLKRSFTAVSKALSDLKENIFKAMLISCFSQVSSKERMVSWFQNVSNRFSTQKKQLKILKPTVEESAKASRSVEDLRGELESRREAHAEALTSQRQRLVEEHQEELQSILKSREVELQKKLDDQAEVAKREASSRREAEEVRMFRLPSSLVSFTVWNPKCEY